MEMELVNGLMANHMSVNGKMVWKTGMDFGLHLMVKKPIQENGKKAKLQDMENILLRINHYIKVFSLIL